MVAIDLASVVEETGARSIGPSGRSVIDACSRIFVRFTGRPGCERQCGTVVPLNSSSARFVQSQPVIVATEKRSVFASQNVHTITSRMIIHQN